MIEISGCVERPSWCQSEIIVWEERRLIFKPFLYKSVILKTRHIFIINPKMCFLQILCRLIQHKRVAYRYQSIDFARFIRKMRIWFSILFIFNCLAHIPQHMTSADAKTTKVKFLIFENILCVLNHFVDWPICAHVQKSQFSFIRRSKMVENDNVYPCMCKSTCQLLRISVIACSACAMEHDDCFRHAIFRCINLWYQIQNNFTHFIFIFTINPFIFKIFTWFVF